MTKSGSTYGSLLLAAIISITLVIPALAQEELDYEAIVGDDMREIVVDTVILTMALTTKNGMSGGSFEFGDSDIGDNIKLTVSRYPFTHEFDSFSNRWYQPFVSVNAGQLSMKSPIQIGETPDEMEIAGWSIAAGGGVRIPLSDRIRFSPGLHVLYSKTKNNYDYHDVDLRLLREFFDGIVLNWEVGTFSYGPSLQLDADLPYRSTVFTFSSEWTYLHSETIEEDHPIQKTSAHTSQWKNKIAAKFPLGMSISDMPLSMGVDVARTDIDGKGETFDGAYLYEVGGEIHFDSSNRWRHVSDLYVGAGYTFEEDISGWTFRLGFDF